MDENGGNQWKNEQEKPSMLMIAHEASFMHFFNMPIISLLQGMGYKVEVAANFLQGNTCSQEQLQTLKQQFDSMGVKYHQIDFSRNALNFKQAIVAYCQVMKIMKDREFQFIHCHTPIGGVIGRLVGWRTKTKVIYTAHGFHFFKGAPLRYWMTIYPLEWLLSWVTDVLITINKEDYQRATKHLHAKKTVYVPGVGVDLEKFSDGQINVAEKRRELGADDEDVVLLSVGELSERKNHEVVIRAISELHDSQIKYFISGIGGLKTHLESLIRELRLEEQVKLLGYRSDISELCQACDLFVFPSRQEGLPMALMEAIACRCPVVCTNIRGNTDLVEDYLYDPDDVGGLADILRDIATDRRGIRVKMSRAIEQNYVRVKKFDLDSVMDEMTSIYSKIPNGGGLEHLRMRQAFCRDFGIDDADAVILLSVGELNENKNHSIVIQAIARLKDKRLHYFVAGQGYLSRNLQKLAQDLGIGEQVHLLGYRADVAYLMRMADIYLLPSIREGLNLSLMEAMASGLPVICGRIRGNVDLVEEGKGGYLHNPKDVDEIALCINRLAWSVENRIRFGRYNCEVVKSYSKENVLLQMNEIYKG